MLLAGLTSGNIADNYLTKAIAMHISLFTNVGKSQISETETHFNIERVPVTVDGAVMNGIRYPADENEKGMDTIKDKVVTLSHPTANGEGVDAYAGESLQKFFSGGYITDKYRNNGVWYVNISIKKSMLKAQDGGEDFYNMLENKQPIGVSTGLYTVIAGNAGKTEDGKEYRGDATNQAYNHLAMLPNSEPPAGGSDTFMHFNHEEAQGDMLINLAEYMKDSMPQEEKPSVEVEVEQKSDEVESLLTKLLAMIGLAGTLKGNQDSQTHEENAMSIDNMVKALKEANAYKDGMSDDEVKNAYDKLGKDKDEPKGNSETAELVDAVNALTAKVESLESQLNAKEQADKDALVAEVNALDTGIEEADLKSMSVNSLQALKDKHQPVTNSVNGQFRQPASNGADEEYLDIN